jgi:hypothetical protein
MRQTILSLSSLLLTLWVWAQGSPADKAEMDTIQRVKSLLISTLDHDLPKVTLEFFLRYEGGGAPIKWEVNECDERTVDTVVAHGRDSMCVKADIGLKDGRTVIVLVSVGKLKKDPAYVPTVYGVRVAYPEGTIHRLDRLRDLPVELHRPPPKGPKDLPPPVPG